MKKTILISICVFISTFALSQSNILPKFLESSAVFIEVENTSTGSGLFVQNDKNIYLVTAKHVISDEKLQLKGSKIQLSFYSNDPFTSAKNILIIDLVKANNTGRLKHHQSKDISIINIADLVSSSPGKSAVLYNNSITKVGNFAYLHAIPIESFVSYDSVYVSEDIYLMGYPTSLSLQNNPQYDFSRPLLRKGVLAGKNVNNRTLIVDCPVFHGNSGGPIFLKKEIDPLNFDIKFLGIIVQYIPYTERILNLNTNIVHENYYNSGYSIIEPASEILSIINN